MKRLIGLLSEGRMNILAPGIIVLWFAIVAVAVVRGRRRDERARVAALFEGIAYSIAAACQSSLRFGPSCEEATVAWKRFAEAWAKAAPR